MNRILIAHFNRSCSMAALAAALVCSAHAQAWTLVAPESSSTTLTIPAGTTYKFGIDDCPSAGDVPAFSMPITVAADTTFSPLNWPSGVFPFVDPCDGSVKSLYVFDTALPQTLILNGAAFLVPALPPPPAPVSIATPPGQIYAVTLSPIQTPPSTNPPWFGIVDLPASGANVTFESTQFTLTIGGVALTCTYASRSGAIYTLNCVVPPAQSTTPSMGVMFVVGPT